MNPTVRKNLITNALIIVGFAVLAMIYAFPAVQGKILAAHDNISWRGISEEARQEYVKTHKPVLWSNSMFGGMPSYTFYSGSTKNIFSKIQDGLNSVLPRPVNFLFLAMVSMYVLGLVLRINRWASVIGALAYGFATFFLVSAMAGHDTKVLAMAYMPAVLAGFFLTFRGNYLGGAALLMISLALMCLTGHYQILYYEAAIVGLAWIVLLVIAVREGRIKQFAIASLISGGVAALAVLSILGSFLVTKEYNEYTMRGGNSELTIGRKTTETKKTGGGLDKEYAFQYSEGTSEIFTILVPDLYGASMNEPLKRFSSNEDLYSQRGYLSGDEDDITVPMYWGPQPIQAGPVYFGATICFLFLLGMIVIRSPHKWWMAAISFIAILMSMGKNLPGLNYFLFDHLPMFNNFRTPAMILVIPEMLFPLVGAWGIAEIIAGRADSTKLIRNIFIAAGITAGLALVLGIGFGMSDDLITASEKSQMADRAPDLMEALREDRSSLARNGGFLSAFYILLTAGLMWLFAKGTIAAKWTLAGIGLVVAIDLIPVAARYVNSNKFKDKEEYDARNFQKRQVDEQILQDTDPDYRVLDVTRNIFNDAQTSFYHKSIGGYSPAKMEMYQDLIDVHLAQGFNEAVVNMLNTKYIIAGQAGQEGVIPNPAAAGHAWFVNEIKWVPNADQEMLSMNARRLGDTVDVPNVFDPKRTAIVRDTFEQQLGKFTPGKDSAAAIRLTSYGLNDLSYQSNNAAEGLAVFSEIWYPAGWKAFVDDKEVPIVRANYVLRAIKVPAGQHKIDFRFRPATYAKGERIAFFASLAGLLLVIAGAGVALMRSLKDDGQKAAVKQG